MGGELTLDDFKQVWEQKQKESQSVCPNCGYCPHCGRGGYRPFTAPYTVPYPYTPYTPYPWWQPSTTTVTVKC